MILKKEKRKEKFGEIKLAHGEKRQRRKKTKKQRNKRRMSEQKRRDGKQRRSESMDEIDAEEMNYFIEMVSPIDDEELQRKNK